MLPQNENDNDQFSEPAVNTPNQAIEPLQPSIASQNIVSTEANQPLESGSHRRLVKTRRYLLLLLIIILGFGAYQLIIKPAFFNNKKATPISSSLTSFPTTYLVFNNALQGVPIQTEVTNPGGKILKTFSVSNSSGQAEVLSLKGAEILFANEGLYPTLPQVLPKNMSMLDSSLEFLPVNIKVQSQLDQNSSFLNYYAYNSFVGKNNTVFMMDNVMGNNVVTNSAKPEHFIAYNVQSGEAKVLLTIQSINSNEIHFLPSQMSLDSNQISFFAYDVVVNNQYVNGAGVVLLNLTTGKIKIIDLTSFTNSVINLIFPILNFSTTSPPITTVAVSPNGEYVIYSANANKLNIYNTNTNSSVSVNQPRIGTLFLYNGYGPAAPEFSLDNSYALIFNESNLQVLKTSDWKSIKTIYPEGYFNSNMSPCSQQTATLKCYTFLVSGWINQYTIVYGYEINPPPNSNDNAPSYYTYTYDIETGKLTQLNNKLPLSALMYN